MEVLKFVDKVSEVFNSDTPGNISKKTGLEQTRVFRIAKGMPFVMDWQIESAIKALGYDIEIKKKHNI